jgi:uncharacterized ferredoxin-like protein
MPATPRTDTIYVDNGTRLVLHHCTIAACTVSGLHCEGCGSTDFDTDDGYTTCCNEPATFAGPNCTHTETTIGEPV